MFSASHMTYIAIVIVLLQSRDIHAASEHPACTSNALGAVAESTAELSVADQKIEALEKRLLVEAEKKRKLIDIGHRMRAKRLALDLDNYQLKSDNMVLREKLDYEKSNPCPWAIIVGNITGTAAEKLNHVCNGASSKVDQKPSKRRKRHSIKNGMVPREGPLEADDQALAMSLTDVAFALQASERYEEAEPLFAWALMIIYTDRAGNHLPIATALKNLANLYLDMNAYAKAESAYRRALAEYRYVFDENHPKLASIQNMLAASLRGQKNYLEAEEMYLKSIATYKSVYGSKNLRLVAPIHNLSQLYIDVSRYTDSEIWLQQALAIVNENKSAKTYRVHLDETQRRLENAMGVQAQDVTQNDLTNKKDEQL